MRFVMLVVLSMLTLQLQPPSAWAAAGILAEPDDFEPVVSFELNRENRRFIQEALGQRGYDVGRADGQFGAKTRRGIKLYQTDRGDAATGKLTEDQIKDLLAAHGPRGVDLDNVRPTGFAARQAARALGGKCSDESADAARVHSGTKVRLEKSSANIGEHMTLAWTAPSSARRMPLYLVVSFDASVRFGGSGFYALTSNAEGPFGISWETDKIRAIVPLSPNGENTQSGSIQIKPMRAGPLHIKSAIVHYVRKCMRETNHATGSFKADIFASPFPEVLADDTTTLARPSHRLMSSTTEHYIDVFKGYFELVEKASGSRIARINGSYPGFSPGGHFFYAQRDGERFFGDTQSGRIVYSRKGTRFHGWTMNDSFAAFGNNDNRALTIVPMLIDNADFLPKRRWGLSLTGFALNRKETGYGDVNEFDFRELFELSLENNFLLVSSADAFFLFGLDRKFVRALPNLSRPTPLREIEQRRLANVAEVKRLLQSEFLLSPFDFQVKYTYHALYNFNNHLVASGVDLHVDAPTIRRLQRNAKAEWRAGTYHLQTLTPVTARTVAVRTAAGTVSNRSVAKGDWRGFARVSQKPKPAKKIFQRLEEFGIGLAKIQEPERFALRGTRDTVKHLSKPVVKEDGDVLTSLPGSAEATAALPSAVDIRKQIYELFPGTRGQIDVARNRDYAAREDNACPDPAHKVILGALGSSVRRWIHADGETWLVSARRCTDRYFKDKNPYYILDTRFKDKGFQPISRLIGRGLRLEQMKSPVFSLHGGKHLMVWGQDRGLFLIDLADLAQSRGIMGRRVKQKYADIRLGFDLEHVVDVKPDGSFELLRLRSAEKVLSGRHVDDEIVVWTEHGFFDSTPEGSHLIKIRFAGAPGTYSFHQYERPLRRSGLVASVMAGTSLGRPEIGVAPAVDARLSLSGDTLRGEITRRSRADVSQLLVFQDGILTDKIAAPKTSSFTFKTERRPGTRWASVLAVSSDGLASLPSGRDLGAPPTSRKIHSLAVGVDRYTDPSLPPLRFAVADAKLLSGTFETAGKDAASQGHHVLLDDENASAKQILHAAKEVVSNASPGDTVVISFAGHGVRDAGGKFYLATSETSTQNLAGTALSWDSLASVLAGSKARVLVLLDACHSGMAGSKFLTTNDEAASDLLSDVPTGMIVFAASKGREFAAENSQLGHGLFSLAIANVVSKNRKANDLNNNGAIEISEFYYGVKRQVVEQAKQSQTPWLARNQMVGEFALF